MGSWMNKDTLFLKYGTDKAKPNTGGDFCMPGELRHVEVQVDLTKLTTSPLILSDVTFFSQDMFIEKVEVVADVAAVGGTSISVGLIQTDRTTVLSNTAFVAALPIASINANGETNLITAGTTYAGAYVGGHSALPGYLTALAAGTFTDGKVTVRVFYRGVPPITH